MPRQAHHSKNWGGKRPGTGGGKPTGPNRMTAKAIEMAESAKVHPFDYLLSIIADESQSVRDRLNASAAALPSCLSKQATQIALSRDTDNMSEEQLLQRYLATQSELVRLLPQGKLINGTAERLNGTAKHAETAQSGDEVV